MIRRITAVLGILFPAFFVIYVLRLHGMIDYISRYSPLQRNLIYLAVAGIAVCAALVVDLIWRKEKGRRAISVALWIASSVSILLTLGFAAYIMVPRYKGGGDLPPQLLVVDSPAGQKTPGLAVAFYTEKASKNTVLWGETDGKLKPVSEKTAANSHRIRLDGLKPNTEYMYAVNDMKPVFFRTPPAAGQTLWFAAAGDMHVGNENSNPEVSKKIMAEIAKPTNGYAMFFSLGDLAQLGYSEEIWRQVGGATGPYTKSIPTVLLPGNHDMLLGGINNYRKYLSVQPDSADGPLWQRLDVGDIHFLLLDLEWGLQAYTPAEKAWFETQLKSIPEDDWTIVMSHTFFYCSGGMTDGWDWYDNEPVIKEFEPLFTKYDVDLVLSGHKHQAEFLQKNGVSYMIAGTLGGQLDTDLDKKSPASVWLKQNTFGFADVTISGDTATVTFRDPDYDALFKETIKK